MATSDFIPQAASAVRIVSLGAESAHSPDYRALAAAFQANNPGYELLWLAQKCTFQAQGRAWAIFVQGGKATIDVLSVAADPVSSEVGPGDVLLLRENELWRSSAPLSVLGFGLPEALPPALPTFLRPDWDPRVCDRPGGCAEEERAYRRILLTWLESNGPYVLRELNAHRVRMWDSLSHYHPQAGGFDEFYLVQEVAQGARLYTSEAVAEILQPEQLERARLRHLIREHPLQAGDLVYLPRGCMHRAVAGVLAQVITVPGFRPGAEVGLDHKLREINSRFALTQEEALPLRNLSADAPIVR